MSNICTRKRCKKWSTQACYLTILLLIKNAFLVVRELSDPRIGNHESIAIGNHNFISSIQNISAKFGQLLTCSVALTTHHTDICKVSIMKICETFNSESTPDLPADQILDQEGAIFNVDFRPKGPHLSVTLMKFITLSSMLQVHMWPQHCHSRFIIDDIAIRATGTKLSRACNTRNWATNTPQRQICIAIVTAPGLSKTCPEKSPKKCPLSRPKREFWKGHGCALKSALCGHRGLDIGGRPRQ